MKGGDQIEEIKHPSLPQGVECLFHARNRLLAGVADLVEIYMYNIYIFNFLVVHGDRNASRRLRDDHQRARVRRGGVQD